MTHAWCSDPSRDAAVRAAEDGRDRPMPTLGEAIARPFADAASGGGEGEMSRAGQIESADGTNTPKCTERDNLAASGGGEGEPDAFGVVRNGNVDAVTHRLFRKDAERSAEQWGGTLVPLYRQPPQPPGWLTGVEREAVQWAADAAYDKQHPAEDTLRSVLARSTPPEVVLPCSWKTIQGELVCLHREVIAALAAAGVAVEEVGK